MYVQEKEIVYDEFVTMLREATEKQLGNDYIITSNSVNKNNGQELDGLVIKLKNSNVAPIIYVESFYKQYCKGCTMEDIINKIMLILDDSSGEEYKDIYIDMDYANIKDNIIFKVVNFEKNIKMLNEVPYVKFIDLAVVFMYLVNVDNNGMASIKITSEHMDMWNVDEEQLFRDALNNTESKFPCTLRTMNDVIREIAYKDPDLLFGEDIEWMSEDESEYRLESEIYDNKDVIDEMLDKIINEKKCDMYILSNKSGINGASVILYRGLMQRISQKLDTDFIILPSSIHELILVSMEEFDINNSEIKNIVKEINLTQVPRDEVLSDSVYYYKREDNIIKIA